MDLLRKEERTALLEALRAACPETPDLIWVATPLRSKRRKLWRELLRSALDHSQLFAAVSWRQYILDHSQLFAALAFKDLLRRLGLPVAPFQRLRVWADCGARFCGYLSHWEFRSVCLEFGLAEAMLYLYAEHHGKSRCDGQIGLHRSMSSRTWRT